MDWYAHTRALAIKPWLQYMDGSRKLWKKVLDIWVKNRYAAGRGAPLTTNAPTEVLRPLNTHGSHIPPLLREGLHVLHQLRPTPLTPQHYATADEAKAEPVFDGLRTRVKSKHEGWWRTQMQHQRMGDFVHYDTSGEGRPALWPAGTIRAMVTDALPPHRQRQTDEPTIQGALYDYDRMELQLPPHLLAQLTDQHTPAHDPMYSSAARHIFQKRTWKEIATGALLAPGRISR